jgi:hypothetical protein
LVAKVFTLRLVLATVVVLPPLAVVHALVDFGQIGSLLITLGAFASLAALAPHDLGLRGPKVQR